MSSSCCRAAPFSELGKVSDQAHLPKLWRSSSRRWRTTAPGFDQERDTLLALCCRRMFNSAHCTEDSAPFWICNCSKALAFPYGVMVLCKKAYTPHSDNQVMNLNQMPHMRWHQCGNGASFAARSAHGYPPQSPVSCGSGPPSG